MYVNRRGVVGPLIAALSVFASATNATEQPQQGMASEPQCRVVVEMDPRRGPVRQTLCQQPDGSWQAAANGPDGNVGMGATSGALAPNWRGRIRYTGSLEGSTQQQLRLPNRLTPNSVLGTLNQMQGRPFGGAYELVLTFEGNAVSGTYSGNGTGVGRGNISGTRDGSRCRLFTSTVIVEGECTADRFVGNSRSQGGSRTTQTARIETFAVEVVDAAEEERRLQAAAAEAEQQRAVALAERQRAAEAERARIAALPRAQPAPRSPAVAATNASPPTRSAQLANDAANPPSCLQVDRRDTMAERVNDIGEEDGVARRYRVNDGQQRSYRNNCATAVSYIIKEGPISWLGGGRDRTIEINAGATDNWYCRLVVNRDLIFGGFRTGGIDYCRRTR